MILPLKNGFSGNSLFDQIFQMILFHIKSLLFRKKDFEVMDPNPVAQSAFYMPGTKLKLPSLRLASRCWQEQSTLTIEPRWDSLFGWRW